MAADEQGNLRYMQLRLHWIKRIGLAAGASTLAVACSGLLPDPSVTAELVDRNVGPWRFREASDQVSVESAMAVQDAEQAGRAHLAEQYRAPLQELALSDALYRRNLVSIDAFGGGAQDMRPGDAWVLRFSSSTDPDSTTAWVVVGAEGQIKASWFGY